ncbi:MAG: pyruvate, water dikinase regulatory protein [Planctomycetota bacterium]|nr:pyruvate, water dikinase regulatory protein [Planctomycetota bacterium]
MMSPVDPIIIAVSDSTGETATAAGRAALAQFGNYEDAAVRTAPNVRNEDGIVKVLRRARDMGAMIIYTLVEEELRSTMQRLAPQHEVHALDLIGGIIRGLARHLDRTPFSVPGLMHELDDEYFRRVAAVEFTVNHDDGKNPQNLTRADIVVVGISRASKTPLSNYIAHRGFRVANVPIVMGLPLPPELDDVDPRRVFALTIDPIVLMKIRQARMEVLGMGMDSDYGDLRQIRREVNNAKRVFRDHPDWQVVDMSRKAVEEAASSIIETYRWRFGSNGAERRRSPRPAKRAGKKKNKKAARKKASKKKSAKKAAKKAAKKKVARKKAAKKKARKQPAKKGRARS